MLLADLRSGPYAPVADRPLTSFSENVAATYRGVKKTADMFSARDLLEDEYDSFIEGLDDGLPHPMREKNAPLYRKALADLKEAGDRRTYMDVAAQWDSGGGQEFRERVFWDSVPAGSQRPGLEGIRKRLPARAREEEAEWQEVRRRSVGFSGGLGALVGETGAFFTNPVAAGLTALTLPLGVGGAALSRIGTMAVMARSAGIGTGIEAGIEAVQQPGIWRQREQLELENSWWQAASSVALAGAFGGILGGGAAGVSKLLQRSRAAREARAAPPRAQDAPPPEVEAASPAPPPASPLLAGADGLPRAEFYKDGGRDRLLAGAWKRIERMESMGGKEAEEFAASMKEAIQAERVAMQDALRLNTADLAPNQQQIFTRSVDGFFDEVEGEIDAALKRGEGRENVVPEPVVQRLPEKEAEEIAAETVLAGDVTLAERMNVARVGEDVAGLPPQGTRAPGASGAQLGRTEVGESVPETVEAAVGRAVVDGETPSAALEQGGPGDLEAAVRSLVEDGRAGVVTARNFAKRLEIDPDELAPVLDKVAGEMGLLAGKRAGSWLRPEVPKPPRRPQDIIDFLAGEGGIKDSGGELAAMDLSGKFVPGAGKLVRTRGGGRSLDYARERVVEEGFLPEGATVNDLLDALGETDRGRPLYRDADLEAADQYDRWANSIPDDDLASEIGALDDVPETPVETPHVVSDAGGQEWWKADDELLAQRTDLEERLAIMEEGDAEFARQVRDELDEMDGYGEFMDEVKLCLGRTPAGDGE